MNEKQKPAGMCVVCKPFILQFGGCRGVRIHESGCPNWRALLNPKENDAK